MLSAKIGLMKQGLDFAMSQLKKGIQAFSTLLSDCEELETFRNAVTIDYGCNENGNSDAAEIDSSEEDNKVEDGHSEMGSDDDENDGGGGDDGTGEPSIQKEELDSILRAFGGDPQCLSNAVTTEATDTNVCWKFPENVSQGTLNGRNGSNACSFIALIIANVIQGSDFPIPIPEPSLPITWIQLLCTGIEVGNSLYDKCRHSLPSRYLAIDEAAEVLQSWYEIAVEEPLPVRLQDEHAQSTVHNQLAAAARNGARLALFIINERTSLFVINSSTVIYIDTHAHNPHGAVIVQGSTSNLEEFCKDVWHLEHNSESTYGNLVFVTFL